MNRAHQEFHGFDKLLYGGDYNPEQWLDSPEILKKDIEYMKKAHINVVSLGIFAWSTLEPEEGVFNFSWMEERINTLHENGIGVFLATPSGARPKWLADKYPEVLRTNAQRQKMLFGHRHNHCLTSPVYREKVRIINTELAKRFGKHPGVLAWHISNEYGGECHCPLCQEAFRTWLKARYQSIDRLNKAWSTTFWSHTYQSFDQIESPSPIGEPSLHGLNLDWRRFVTDQTVDFARAEIQAVRDAGSDKPATTNMMYNFNDLNYHKFAPILDFISWDTYPTWHKHAEYQTALDCAMQHDIMRSILKKPFILMESCPSATNWQPVSKLKKPGMLEAASLQAIAHGSDSVMYFQFRQSRGSFEKFHGAVIDHYGGDDTRVYKEVQRVGSDIRNLNDLHGSLVKAKAAVIYDWENRWAMENAAGPRNENLYYKETVQKSYNALRRYGLNVDMIDMEQPLDGYQFVAVPMLYMLRAGFAEKARRFTAQGGVLCVTYWSGIVDETDNCFLGGTPHDLMDVLGLRSEEIDGLYDGECNHAVPVCGNRLGIEKTYRCENLCELVKLDGAETLMTYGEDFYAGQPVVTVNQYGKGAAYYIGADMEQAFYTDAYSRILKQHGIENILNGMCLPEGVAVSSREGETGTWILIQNFNRTEISMESPEDAELVFGADTEHIPALGTVVYRKNRI